MKWWFCKDTVRFSHDELGLEIIPMYNEDGKFSCWEVSWTDRFGDDWESRDTIEKAEALAESQFRSWFDCGDLSKEELDQGLTALRSIPESYKKYEDD